MKLLSFALAATFGVAKSLLTQDDIDNHGKTLGECVGKLCNGGPHDGEGYCSCSDGLGCTPDGGCGFNPTSKEFCECETISIESLLGSSSNVGADNYGFTVTLSNEHIAYIKARGNVCLMKSVVDLPMWTPVWVTLSPFENMDFSWQKQYKAFYTNSFYDGGVTIAVSGDEDTKLGGCTVLNMDDLLTECQDDPGVKAIALRNDRMSGDWTMGLEQTVVVDNGKKALRVGGNPFFAKLMGNEGGVAFVEPLERITIGICEQGAGELAKFSSLAGHASFLVTPTNAPSVTFDGAGFVVDDSPSEAVY